MGTFTAQLGGFQKKTLDNLEIIYKNSAQRVVAIANTPKSRGGRIPVDTGFLRNSLNSTILGGALVEGDDSYILVVAGFNLGDTLLFGWTAAYARRIELGFAGTDSLGRVFNQPGAFFVANAAAQWPQIVDREAARL